MINTRRQAPVSTSTLPALMDALADPDATATSVADAAAADHGLVSRIIGLANSAHYGMVRTISQLDHAIALIGFDTVRTLAIANSVGLLSGGGVMDHTRQHAMEVAVAARMLAPVVGARPSEAFAAGLLHDIGELLLLQARPAEYRTLYPTFKSHAQQLTSEAEIFGEDHALLGAEHLLDWRVPDVIADAVADHHDPFSSAPPTTIAVAAADELMEGDPNRHVALDLVGIDADAADGLRNQVHTDAAELVTVFC